MRATSLLVLMAVSTWLGSSAFQHPKPSDLTKQGDHIFTSIRVQDKLLASYIRQLTFGIINDQGNHYADEWSRGVQATTFELHWDLYETAEGHYDPAYIAHMKAILSGLKAQGWQVQLILGIQYTPGWVYTTYPDIFYINQYGERYDPDPVTLNDYRVINAPFNPRARDLISAYIERVFTDFKATDFSSVRIGGGPQGELRYPPAEWNGHTNSYWAYDPSAQDPAVSGIPIIALGWRPGIDPNPGTTGHGQLIVNPGFEQTDEWLPLLGWTPDEEVVAARTAQDPHGGENALKLSLTTTNRIHQYVRIEPNTTYQFGGWGHTAGVGLARIFLTQYDAGTQIVPGAPFAKLETSAGTWTNLSGSLTTSATTRYLKVEMDGSQPGTYSFDDLWLKRQGETDDRDRNVDVPLAFYNWYVQKLTDYQNWQIAEVRKYTADKLDVLYAGKGLMADHLNDALTNDLLGDGWSESNSALYGGTPFDRHVAGLETTSGIVLYLTGIEQPSQGEVDDNSPYPGDWSAAHWIAYLAATRGLEIWGENSGQDSPAQMDLAMERLRAFGYSGLMWGFESQLYADPTQGFATIDDYQSGIEKYGNVYLIFLPALP